MPERVGFPAGVPAWIDLRQPDPGSAASFYSGLFGWRYENRMSSGSPSYMVASLDGRDVAAIGAPIGPQIGQGWNTYIAVESADATAAKVRKAGGTVIADAADLDGVGRVAICADPSSAVIGLWQPGTIAGAAAVNRPGTWNFSELRTREVENAKRFYGAVFGWEVDEVDMGAMSGMMVRLPGYADFLEQFDPGIRERHAAFGAPPGFSECVAWFLPLAEADAPHWSITFAVADTDAVAGIARELGGSVIVEPYDVAPVRSAVLRDPQGATFTVSAFSAG